jgi:hypothetical protein
VELADLEAVLGRDGKATITHASVFGLGGVGKTAVAIAEARLPPDHPDLAIYRMNLAFLGPPP